MVMHLTSELLIDIVAVVNLTPLPHLPHKRTRFVIAMVAFEAIGFTPYPGEVD